MSDERTYLWQRSGPPDPEVERLERVLAPLRYRGEAPELADRSPQRRRHFWPLAAAAALVLAAPVTWFLVRGGAAARPGWEVQAQAGEFLIDSASAGASARLGVGQWLETPSDASARVAVAGIGSVTVYPNSRLCLLATGNAQHRLRLEQGTIEANISAPPRLFVVDTPAAAAVDYGCAYKLVVDPAGSGVLAVTLGFVALEQGGRRVIVPSTALCRMRPGIGPGTPFFADASDALKEALDALDFGGADRRGALDTVLGQARPRDALSLWYLMTRPGGPDPDQAGAVYDRLAELAPPPPGITRAGVLAREDPMLRAWAESLDLLW